MTACPDCEQYQAEIKELKDKLRKIEIEGWKGRDELMIEKVGTEWIIVEHRKDKETGEIANVQTIIPELNVANLWILIKLHCKTIGAKTNYRKLVPSILEKYHIPISVDEFNGGTNRASYYFPLYYYCCKILEHLKFIKYGGRGSIVRLK